MLSRRDLFGVLLALGSAALTGVDDLARAVALGTRAAMRRGMRVLAPQKGEWVNNNIWGDQRTQPLPATENQTVSVLPKNTSFYGPPSVHSIQLVRNDEIAAENADVYALVTVGCGGIENQFLCDWLHGVQLSLVCNSIHVDAVSYIPGIQPYDASDATVFLGVMLAKGAIAQGRLPATKTERIVELAAGGAAAFPVVDFAREVTGHFRAGAVLNSNPATPTLVTISCTKAGGGVLARYDLQVCAGGRSIPIPGGTTEIRYVNGSAAAVTITNQFFLGF